MNGLIISVKQLNAYVKSLIESDARLSYISISGEISNFKNHYSSGHWYFTLKDAEAQIRCVMFKSANIGVLFPVEDGMRVILSGRVSVYEKDGQYQFYAEEIHPDGEGDLAVAFNILKEKLDSEGLFAAEHKRPIKKFPKRIAVLTSDTGAAVRDILNITSKRYPLCDILLCPVIVQGENAVDSMVSMLDRVYAKKDIDTIIIGRGGGSIEDLWAFNSEKLSRKIYSSPIPVISAVGHETDFTICDFVADVRASTPSHAAELAVPDINAVLALISTYKQRCSGALNAKCNNSTLRLNAILSRPAFADKYKRVDSLSVAVDKLEDRIRHSVDYSFKAFEKRLSDTVSRIDAMSPLKVLSRGYASVTLNGNRVHSVSDFKANQMLNLTFADGTADCEVKTVKSFEV